MSSFSVVVMARGGLLVVSLEATRTTGYGWRVSQCEEAVLRLEGDPTYSSGGATGRVGAGGIETFRLRAVRVGVTELVLGYVRPWEEAVTPARNFTLHIRVR